MDGKFLSLEAAINMVLNINVGKDVRIRELEKVEEYADGLVNLSKGEKAELKAVIKAFEVELFEAKINEECIGGYYRILKKLLNAERGFKGRKCVVYGNNWLSDEVEKKIGDRNYHAFNWRVVNPGYLDEFDLYILCDEPLEDYGISKIQNEEKIIRLWDCLKYKFLEFPAFYRTYAELKREPADKVKCIVTGGRNIVHAVRGRMLHIKAVSVANDAQDIFYDFRMFCHAYETMPNIEYTIIGLTPYSLRYDVSKSREERWRCLVYYPIVESMHNYGDGERIIASYKSEYIKIKRYFEEEYVESLYDLYETADSKTGQEGVYEGKTLSKEAEERDEREIREMYNCPHIDILLENKVLLEGYARFCQTKGIKAIFFIPPYTKWYKKHMKKNYYEELVSTVKMLCSKYGARLINMMDVSLPDCCFKDYENVNHIGAVKVASYINGILENE